MNIRVIDIKSIDEARAELASIGADQRGVELMAPKAANRALKLVGVRPVAANIIKQEMLSLGGEAATAYGSINHSVAATDLLIFGSLKQLGRLMEKLQQHQFGLPQLASEIKQVLDNYEQGPESLEIKSRLFDFSQRTYLVGILNVTPDSFSDGGKFNKTDAAVAQAKEMLKQGADIIDIGGESTRPGAEPVSSAEEQSRVLPIIKRLTQETDAIISIDTTKAQVAQAALEAGAAMVNDISGLRFDKDMAKVVADHRAALCLMHIKGQPQTMQLEPTYTDLMAEIIKYLSEGLAIAAKAGILLGKIIIDPGFGFGKTLAHNLEILKRLDELKVLGRPILVGTSRKSMIGKLLNLPVDQREEGTAATVAISIFKGAHFVRVHDVAKMARVAKMTDAIVRSRRQENGW